jgi:hypothetical protein
MDPRFKETAEGGLATTPTGRRLARMIWQGKPPEELEKDASPSGLPHDSGRSDRRPPDIFPDKPGSGL